MKLFEHKPFDLRAVMGFGILNGISFGLLIVFNSVCFYKMRDATICFQIRQNAKLPSIQSGTTRQKFNQCKVQSATLIKANDSIKLELKFGIGNVFMVTGGGNRGTCWNFETIQAREIIVNFHTRKNILFLYRR
ncbi:hypothetical protein LWI29_028810 [Acer saccharum]|uniref:Uncharacterized protein n=1 Tax=Acer saccharum TaxID=4024 RepID=A0AA39SV59_ACESA|nr:hypothetical protein LWI29_028810 [Acer saccharum]